MMGKPECGIGEWWNGKLHHSPLRVAGILEYNDSVIAKWKSNIVELVIFH